MRTVSPLVSFVRPLVSFLLRTPFSFILSPPFFFFFFFFFFCWRSQHANPPFLFTASMLLLFAYLLSTPSLAKAGFRVYYVALWTAILVLRMDREYFSTYPRFFGKILDYGISYKEKKKEKIRCKNKRDWKLILNFLVLKFESILSVRCSILYLE